MLGTELTARSRRFATFGWILTSMWLVPAACGGDLLINYDDEDQPNQSEGGAAGEGDAEGGAAGWGAGGEDATGGVGGDPTNPSTGGSHVGSGGKGGGSGGTSASGGTSPTGGSGGTSASGGTSPIGGSGGTTVATCGDGNPDESEECDDGNVKNGDGCSSSCVDTSACDDCMNANCVETEGPLTELCFNMPGVSTVGTAVGRGKGELCWEMTDCIHREVCIDELDEIKPCYCGSAQGPACLTAAANGPCHAEIQAALETTATDQIANAGDVTHPSGLAYALVLCTYQLCFDQCHGALE
jgi:cysteine-rich repeat protein